MRWQESFLEETPCWHTALVPAYGFCSDDKNVRTGATNFEDVWCISLVSVLSRLKEESNWTLADAEPYIESLLSLIHILGSADVMERVSLTGKAKRWQLDGKGTESSSWPIFLWNDQYNSRANSRHRPEYPSRSRPHWPSFSQNLC